MIKEIIREEERALGSAIRLHRILKGKNQKDLSKILGISIQQIQKYETGQNRISAIKVMKIANYLKIPVTALMVTDQVGTEPFVKLINEEDFLLLKNYRAISNKSIRDCLSSFVIKLSQLV